MTRVNSSLLVFLRRILVVSYVIFCGCCTGVSAQTNNGNETNNTTSTTNTIVIEKWLIPGIFEYPPQSAVVGDTIEFYWEGGPYHDVWIHDNLQCDIVPEQRRLVGTVSPAVYEFTADDVNKVVFFSCDKGGHCWYGMQLRIYVYATIQDQQELWPQQEQVLLQQGPSSLPNTTSTTTTAAPEQEKTNDDMDTPSSSSSSTTEGHVVVGFGSVVLCFHVLFGGFQ